MLKLAYIPEDRWHGELRVEAAHAGFSGQASAWFNVKDLRTFATDVRALAHNQTEETVLKGAYFSGSTASSWPVETHIGISIARHPTRFIAAVELAGPENALQSQSARLQIAIEWAALFSAADSIEFILEYGGVASLDVTHCGGDHPALVRAPFPIQRPYSPYFMALRDQLSALIAGMARKSSILQPINGQQMPAEEWEDFSPDMIIATIDWDNARLLLNWGVDDITPEIAARSPQYVLNMSEWKSIAGKSDHPRAFFQSYAAYALAAAQDYLTDFYRDGPTDDIPFQRHLIFVRGLTGAIAPILASNVQFTFEELPT